MLKPTDLTDKYVTSTRAADAGAIDGGNNWPPHDAKVISKTEREITELAQADLNELAAAQKQDNDAALVRIRQLEGRLPFDLGFRAEQFLTRAETKIVEVDRQLVRLYRSVLDRERDYRRFKAMHRLDREAEPAPSLYVAIAWLSFAMVADGSLNAYFFKDVGPLGFVGGFLIAFVISACNIALGFACGWGPARYFTHRHQLHLLWAVPLFTALIGGIAGFNLGAAHYRDLIVHSPDIEVSGVLDDLYRNAGRIPSFQSCLMAIVGMGVAAFAAIKGYTILDPYPGYGAVYKRMRDAQSDLEAEIVDIKEAISQEAEGFLERAQESYAQANKAMQDVLDQYDALISSHDQFEMSAAGIDGACRNALETYREFNRRARDIQRSPPPAYFFEEWQLVRRKGILDSDKVTAARDALRARQSALKIAWEKLAQDVPAATAKILSEGDLKRRLEEIMRQGERDDEKEQTLRGRTPPAREPDE
jgi:hypothetical protein